MDRAVRQVDDLDAGRASVLDDDTAHERLGDQLVPRVGAGLVAEDDVRPGPRHATLAVDLDGQRHGLDLSARGADRVELNAEPAAYLVGEGGAVEGVPGDAQEALGL